MIIEVFSNPLLIWTGIITATVIFFLVVIRYIRNKFGFNTLPGLSESSSTDPAAILVQINNIQNAMGSAASLNQVIQDMIKLRTNLSGMTMNSIYLAIQMVQSEIDIINGIIASDNTNSALNADTVENLREMITSLTEQVSKDLLLSLQKLSNDLNNPLPSIILADLNELKTALSNAYSNEDSLVTKIDNILKEITDGVTLNPADKQKIANILNQVSIANSANSTIASNVLSIQSNLNSAVTDTNGLVNNLNQLNSIVQVFVNNNTEQLTNINNQISSVMNTLNDQSTGLNITNSSVQSNVNSILTNIQILGITSNSIQTLSTAIQQQMGTNNTSTGSLIANLTLLQNAVTQLFTDQTNNYNSLNSSVTSVSSSISSLNTLTSETQDTINNILNAVTSINSSNTTISSNLTSIQNTLGNDSTVNTVANSASTILTNLSSLQTSISNSASANTSSFSSITNSLNSINSSITSGVTLNATTTNQINSALTSIQNTVSKALTKNSFLIAVAQLKQGMPDVATFNKFGLPQLQSMDTANSSLGLTRQFDEYTNGKNIGAAIGRVYTDMSKTPTAYYHIDGTGCIYNVTLGTPYSYNNIADGKTHTIIIQSNTVVYDSSDSNNVIYNQVNLSNGSLGALMYNIPPIGLFSTPWPAYPTILMNTSTVVAGTTKYLFVSTNPSNNTLFCYMSSDGISFAPIDPLTGATIPGSSAFISGTTFYFSPYLVNGVSTGVFMNTATATASTKFAYKSPTTSNTYICSYTEDGGLTPVGFDLVNSAGTVTTARCLWMIGSLVFEAASTKLGHAALTTSADNTRKCGNYMTTTSSGSTQYLYVPNTSNDIFFTGTPMPLGISTDGTKFMATTGSKAIGNTDTTKFCYITNNKLYLTPEPISSSILMTTSSVTGATLYGGYIGSQFYISTDGIGFLPFDTQTNLATSSTKIYIIGNKTYNVAYSDILNVYMDGSNLTNSSGLLYYSPVKNAYFYAAIANGTPGNWLTATGGSTSGSAFASTVSPNSVCIGNYGFIESNNPSTAPKHTGLFGPSGAITIYYNGNNDTTKNLFGFWLNSTDYYVSTDGTAFFKLNSFSTSATANWNTNITTTASYIFDGNLFYPNAGGVYQNYNGTKYLVVNNGQYCISTDGISFHPYDPLTNTTDLQVNILNIPGYGIINTPVGNTAPGVYMNGSSIATSTVFLYKSLSGVSYLSQSANNKDLFYKITSITSTGCTLSSTSQTDILYSNLQNGGFFEYASTNSNHSSGMNVFMNTSTVNSQTIYAYKNNAVVYTSSDGTNFVQLNGNAAILVINGQILNNPMNKPGVMISNGTYYYSYNNALYTSTDFVKFTNPAGDVIYYLESEDVVPASAVTTVNGTLWAKIGLMSVQVYSPSIFTLSYEGLNYSLYWSDSSVLLTNGIYSNPGNTNYLYQYQKNWYVSTDKITFKKVILDANQNPTGVDTSAAGTIYTFNNQVQTSAPATMTNAGKTYWQFGGILYVDPTNLGDTFVYYNNTVYAQQTPANSYSRNDYNFPGTRYIPTYISSGTIFGANNTILFSPVLGAFSLFSNSTNATLINPDRNNVTTITTTSIASSIFDEANRTLYSSKSGYSIVLLGVQGYPNLTPHFIRSPLCDFRFNGMWLEGKWGGCDFYQVAVKATGQGTLQYVAATITSRSPGYTNPGILNVFSASVMGYFVFETSAYFTPSSSQLNWNPVTNKYTGYDAPTTINCNKMGFCGYINPACLEAFSIISFNIPNPNFGIATEFNTFYGIPAAVGTAISYEGFCFTGLIFGNGGFPVRVVVPAVRATFSTYLQSAARSISSTSFDISSNGSIMQTIAAKQRQYPTKYWWDEEQ